MRRKSRAPSPARIRIVGIGGGGGNAVDHMIARGIYGVDFVAVNTDALALSKSIAPTRICIGKNITRYLGSGGNPKQGARAAIESAGRLRASLEGSDMVFITGGMGGGTGTGAAPVIAKLAKKAGAFTVAIVTRPFMFEGVRKAKLADAVINKLKELVDTLIVVPNDRLLDMTGEETSLSEAFNMANNVLYQIIQGISELITVPGLINLDFADVRTVMERKGPTLIGVGRAEGEGRARVAAVQATCSPLLDTTINGARSLLVNITAGPGLELSEIRDISQTIKDAAHHSANIILGTAIDSRLEEELRVTVVATGVEEASHTYHRILPLRSAPVYQREAAAPLPAEHVGTEHPVFSMMNYMVPAFLNNG